MRKLYYASLTYLILGLVAGVFYREWTKVFNAVDRSQLNTLHTHLLVLANGIVATSGGMWGPAQSGIAGMGHILLTGGFIWFFSMLNTAIKRSEANQK